jgi:predicted DNA-binding transcriptional regulator AlpA
MARTAVDTPIVVGVCPACSAEVDVVGTKEAAGVLGVSPSQYQNLKAREDFPKPWSSGLGQGALWLRSDLVDWQSGRKAASLEKLLGSLDGALEGLTKKDREGSGAAHNKWGLAFVSPET